MEKTNFGSAGGTDIPRAPSPFNAVIDAIGEAETLALRVEQLAIALLGSEPPRTNGGSEQSRSCPGGAFGDMEQAATRVRLQIGDAMAALDRIMRVLP